METCDLVIDVNWNGSGKWSMSSTRLDHANWTVIKPFTIEYDILGNLRYERDLSEPRNKWNGERSLRINIISVNSSMSELVLSQQLFRSCSKVLPPSTGSYRFFFILLFTDTVAVCSQNLEPFRDIRSWYWAIILCCILGHHFMQDFTTSKPVIQLYPKVLIQFLPRGPRPPNFNSFKNLTIDTENFKY